MDVGETLFLANTIIATKAAEATLLSTNCGSREHDYSLDCMCPVSARADDGSWYSRTDQQHEPQSQLVL